MKKLKIIGVVLAKIMIGIIVFIALTYAIISLPYTQKKITTYISSIISENIGLQVSIYNINYIFWKTCKATDVVITTKNKAKVASFSKIYFTISDFSNSKKIISIKTLDITNSSISIIKDKHGKYNIQDLLDKFSSKKIIKKSWNITIENIKLSKSNFTYYNLAKSQEKDFGINYNNLVLSDIEFDGENIQVTDSGYNIAIRTLKAKEKSGFNLQMLQTKAHISQKAITCNDLIIFTPTSKISASSLQFIYNSFGDFNDFIHSVYCKADFQFSSLDFKDISYFSKNLYQSPFEIEFSGKITGYISDIKGKNLKISYGNGSRFIGNVEISGLPEISNSFIHITSKQFETIRYDLEHIPIPPYNTVQYLKMPNIIKNVEFIKYSGKFTGFLKDFVAYGTMHTNIGTIKSDILISQTAQENIYNYSGKINCINLDLKKIPLRSNIWGKMNSTVTVKGIYDEKSILTAKVQGEITTIQINSYTYSNILLDGELSKQKFNGNLSVNDPNLLLDFKGLFDFSNETPSFNFTAHVPKANIYKLGLYPQDSSASVEFSTNVDFIGLKLDNLKGKINIPKFSYSGKYGKYESDDINILIDNIDQTRNISFTSEFFDLSVNGKGSYKDLPSFLYDFIKTHIKSLPDKTFPEKTSISPNFNISLKIKKIDSLLTVLFPSIHIAQGTYINTIFAEDSKLLLLEASIPELTINKTKLSNIKISSEGNNSSLNTFVTLDYNMYKGIETLLNFKNDSISLSAFWNNSDIKKYSGSIVCKGIFSNSTHKHIPAIELNIEPTTITIADSIWNLFSSKIAIDSNNIHIPFASFGKNNQLIKLSGTISENPKEKLEAEFFNYNLENFNYLIGNKYVNLKGDLQGKVEIQDFYNNQTIIGNISAPNFSFNGHPLGKLSIASQWIPIDKSIAMNITIQQGTIPIIKAIGNYTPKNKKIDYDIQIKELKINNFKEIFESTLSNFTGYIDGEFTANGELTNPQFQGDLEVKRGKCIVNYTKTLYNFKGKLNSQGSKFIFYDLPINDSLSNIGLASGYFDLKNIRNPKYSISIETDKLLVLNTKEKDNEVYYGTAFFQGNGKIEGDLYYTNVEATGKTLDNSIFNIPLSYGELSENQNFLRFTEKNKTINITKKQNTYIGTSVLINAIITPQTLTQIIFDKTVGDIIKVRGNGNIQMLMNKQGVFTMNGEYLIDEGDYLFTLKNLINKKFIIQKGGTIKFNGDPFDAVIDVLAKYELKASPMPIMDTNSLVNYSRRIPVTCDITLENNLMNPDISYDISVPESATQVSETINTFSSDEKNMQFLSLLLMNTFVSKYETQNINSSATFEVLSNQINNILSQAISNVDVGINYRPSDTYTANEFELALSTQLLNNRILVNVNGYSEFGSNEQDITKTQQSEIAGDVSVEIKLNKEGTFKVKGFSRSNNDPLAENQGNTQGISLFFTREFNSIRDIVKKKGK